MQLEGSCGKIANRSTSGREVLLYVSGYDAALYIITTSPAALNGPTSLRDVLSPRIPPPLNLIIQPWLFGNQNKDLHAEALPWLCSPGK